MAQAPKITLLTLKALARFLSSRKPLAGADLMRELDLPSGTIYPLLKKLESIGWVTSIWEDIDPTSEGRPRKHLYTLTKDGRAKAKQAIRSVAQMLPK